jgi:hypothetical protein
MMLKFLGYMEIIKYEWDWAALHDAKIAMLGYMEIIKYEWDWAASLHDARIARPLHEDHQICLMYSETGPSCIILELLGYL